MNCGRALGLPLVGPSKSSTLHMIHATEIVTQNSHQLLETATQIRTLTALAIMFFFLPGRILLQFGTDLFIDFLQKINWQFVKAYFTSEDPDKNRV